MSRIAVVALVLVTAACAHAPVRPAARPAAASVPAFSFADDTFAFANDIRARHPDGHDLYANYCFVLARAVRQFHRFSRFDPAAPGAVLFDRRRERFVASRVYDTRVGPIRVFRMYYSWRL